MREREPAPKLPEREPPQTLEELKARGRSIIEAWYAEQQRLERLRAERERRTLNAS